MGFAEHGGACTFCGAHVALEVGGSSETRLPNGQRTQPSHASSSGNQNLVTIQSSRPYYFCFPNLGLFDSSISKCSTVPY